MALQITGKLEKISEVKNIESKSGGEPFRIRTIQLDTTRIDPYTGERSQENHPAFEITGKSVDITDEYKVGDVVVVSFAVEGVVFKNAQGEEKQFNRLRAFRLEPYQSRTQRTRPAVEAPLAERNEPQPQPVVDDLPF